MTEDRVPPKRPARTERRRSLLRPRPVAGWEHAVLPVALELSGDLLEGPAMATLEDRIPALMAAFPPGGLLVRALGEAPPGGLLAVAQRLRGTVRQRAVLFVVPHERRQELGPILAHPPVEGFAVASVQGLGAMVEGGAAPPEGAFDRAVLRVADLGSLNPDPEDLRRALGLGCRLFLAPGSMLDARHVDRLGTTLRRRAASLLLEDPFAGGRLDGSFLQGTPTDPSSPRPRSPSELQRWFAPALALGFLAQPGRRTLLQANLRFLLSAPGVTGVALPLTRPELVRQLLSVDASLRLSSVDRARLLALSTIAFAPGAGRTSS